MPHVIFKPSDKAHHSLMIRKFDQACDAVEKVIEAHWGFKPAQVSFELLPPPTKQRNLAGVTTMFQGSSDEEKVMSTNKKPLAYQTVRDMHTVVGEDIVVGAWPLLGDGFYTESEEPPQDEQT
jgi:hypothetical protein